MQSSATPNMSGIAIGVDRCQSGQVSNSMQATTAASPTSWPTDRSSIDRKVTAHGGHLAFVDALGIGQDLDKSRIGDGASAVEARAVDIMELERPGCRPDDLHGTEHRRQRRKVEVLPIDSLEFVPSQPSPHLARENELDQVGGVQSLEAALRVLCVRLRCQCSEQGALFRIDLAQSLPKLSRASVELDPTFPQ